MRRFNFAHYHPHVKEVFKIILDILQKDYYPDKAIEKTIRQYKKWDDRDRAFVVETTYDLLRNWRLLSTLAASKEDVTIYDLWKVFGALLFIKEYAIPEHANFQSISIHKLKERYEKYGRVRKIRESVPDLLDELCEKELGEKWDVIIAELNKKPSTYIRANSLKVTRDILKNFLSKEEIEAEKVDGFEYALRLRSPQNIFKLNAFQNGFFEMQDIASQLVSEKLRVAAGMRIIDACAGAGGKTIHLAALMKNKGKILALDNQQWKLNELKKRATRAGASIIETRVIESSKTIKRLKESADRLLLDVPCSGLGVLKRNPDIKWKLSLQKMEQLWQLQQEILVNYSSMLKPSGILVYATCSILPSEGEEQIKKFIAAKKGTFKLLEETRISPEQLRCDGFYVAVVEKIK